MKIEDKSKRGFTKHDLVVGRCYRSVNTGQLYLMTQNGFLAKLEDGVIRDLANISSGSLFEEVNAKVVVYE